MLQMQLRLLLGFHSKTKKAGGIELARLTAKSPPIRSDSIFSFEKTSTEKPFSAPMRTISETKCGVSITFWGSLTSERAAKTASTSAFISKKSAAATVFSSMEMALSDFSLVSFFEKYFRNW